MIFCGVTRKPLVVSLSAENERTENDLTFSHKI